MVIFLLPALLFDWFANNYRTEKQQLNKISELSEAKIAIARLQRNMDLKTVIKTELKKILQQSGNAYETDRDSKNFIVEFENLFWKKFPQRAKLMWFARDFKVIDRYSKSKIDKKTAWERFLKACVSPESATKTDQKIADGLIQSNMSNFLSSTFFEKILDTPVEVLYKTERIFLRAFRFSFSDPEQPAFLLLHLPIGHARQDWLEQRALIKAARQNLLAGAYRISEQRSLKGSTISDNLLHGFYREFRLGNNYFFDDERVYYFSQHQDNPDLFICVSKALNYPKKKLQPLKILQITAYLPFLLCMVLLIRRRHLLILTTGLSLRTRFKLATTFLTALPIALMVFMGLFYLAQVKIEQEQGLINSLDNSINRFNESVTNQTIQLETFLQSNLSGLLKTNLPAQATAQKAFKFLKNSGCHLAIIFTKSGKIFHSGNLATSLIKPRIAFFYNFIKTPLRDENFALDKFESEIKSPLEGKYDHFREGKFRYDFFGRFNLIELGPTTANLFSTYIRNDKNEVVACVCLGFNSDLMQQYFLKNSLKLNQNNDNVVFIKPRDSQGSYFLPKSSRITELLELTALTRETFVKRMSFGKKDYMVLSRMLKDIPSAATAVCEIKSEPLNLQNIFLIIIFAIGILALINSRGIFILFESEFLQPVMALTDSVDSIKKGKYDIRLANKKNDELGRLKTSFNKMAEGLQEKAAMKNYLSDELLLQAKEKQQSIAERKFASVIFCGIRNFSVLEKKLLPEQSFAVMNSFLSVCDEVITSFGGETDKFIGETIMAFFKEKPGYNATKNAFYASLEIKRRLEEKRIDAEEGKPLNFGIGIASGEPIAGHIGSLNKRLDYTLIGDTVNLAARLEKLAGRQGQPQVLTNSETLAKTDSAEFSSILSGTIKIKGKAKPVKVFEIVRLS